MDGQEGLNCGRGSGYTSCGTLRHTGAPGRGLGHSWVTVTLALYSHVMRAVESEHADAVAKPIGRNRRKLL